MKAILLILLTFQIFSQPLDLSLEWNTNENFILSNDLEDIVLNDISNLSNILGIIIIHNGEIVLENYYNGSSQNNVFNIWSVTKSYTSTLIGQAYDMGYIDDPDSSASFFFPDYNIDYLENISLHNLLTMSSGYIDGYFYPAWYSQSTETLISMFHGIPGTFFYNNSACHLNSHAIYYNTDMTPSEFANIHLFPYLGIENPIWYSGYLGINDGSASLNLNLRDMVKLGQLYIQEGFSGNIQILSEDWIDRATTSHISTGVSGISSYGYLWWLPEMMEGTYLAFGYGGQFIAVIPQYNLIIGSHSTDWGPTEVNTHAAILLDKIYSELVPMFQKGDNNDDAIINVLDIINLINFILSIEEPDNFQIFTSDINSDDILNIQDIILLVQIILD